MAAKLLDGTAMAAVIKAEVAVKVAALKAGGFTPGLAVVLVGEDPASQVYTRNKVRTCLALGIRSEHILKAADTTTDELLAVVAELNDREDVDGILIQLPLPRHIDAKRVLLAVDPDKDVDGFHPVNVGRLSTCRPGLVPCTPAGVMEVLRRSALPIEGQEVVVIGRSDIVGKPVAMLLTNANATVTICHSRTRNLAAVCRRADILIAAIGQAGMVTPEFVRPGATVIDVGINRVNDRAEFERLFSNMPSRWPEFQERGATLCGDVHPAVAAVAGALTPVPGGIGPLTIAMLMVNTLTASSLRCRRAPQEA